MLPTSKWLQHFMVQGGSTCLTQDMCHRTRVTTRGFWLWSDQTITLRGWVQSLLTTCSKVGPLDHSGLNLYDAIHVAEPKNAKAKSGFCPCLPPHWINVIMCPVPVLEHSSGSRKFPVQITICRVCTSWCQKYPDDFSKYAHPLDMKLANIPDLMSFLKQHLEANLHQKECNDQDRTQDTQIEGDGESIGMGADGGKVSHFDGWPAIDYDRDKQSGVVLEMVDTLSGNTLANGLDQQELLGLCSTGKCSSLSYFLLYWHSWTCPDSILIDLASMADHICNTINQWHGKCKGSWSCDCKCHIYARFSSYVFCSSFYYYNTMYYNRSLLYAQQHCAGIIRKTYTYLVRTHLDLSLLWTHPYIYYTKRKYFPLLHLWVDPTS